MWVEMLCHSCSPIRSRTGFAGMTEDTDGLDKSSPYFDRRACPRENGERLSYGFIRPFKGV